MSIEDQIKTENLDRLHCQLKDGSIKPSQYMMTLTVNTELYRFVYPGSGATLPTGKAARTVFEDTTLPYNINQYQEKYAKGINFASIHTGNTFYSSCIQGAWNETAADEPKEKDWYKIVIKKEFKIMDMDVMCNSLGFSRPYIVENHPVFDEFYGYRLKGLRHQSYKYPEGDTVVIFNDWFRDFNDYIEEVPLDKNKYIFIYKGQLKFIS